MTRPPTNRDHALAVIVEILHQHLAETIDFAGATFREIPRQEPILLFQRMHHIGQFLHHTPVRAEVVLLGQHQTKVEDELIAVVAGRLHADWVAQNTVSIGADLQ